MFGNIICRILIYTTAALLSYITVLCIFIKSPSLLAKPSFILLIPVIFGFFILLLFHRRMQRFKISSRIFLLVLIFLTAMPRLIWVLAVNTQPVSDFVLYNEYALNASKGLFRAFHPTYTVFPFKFGYPLLLSVIYRILGTELIFLKLFNILISIGTALQIFSLAKKIFNVEAARAASILYAFWPAQIMFTSVLASEHIFVLFLLLGFQMFFHLIDSVKPGAIYFYALATGISIALAQFIRPMAMILLPAAVFYLLLFTQFNSSKVPSVITGAKISLAIGVAFIAGYLSLCLPLSNITGVPIYKASSGFNLLVGTNDTYGGFYNREDEKIIREFNYDYEKIHKEAARRAFGRILGNPGAFTLLMEKKYTDFWGSEDYGFYWSTQKTENNSPLGDSLINDPYKLKTGSQLFYIFILLLSIKGCLGCIQRVNFKISILLLFFLCIFLAHTFLEIQPRYHYAAIPVMIILAGFGLENSNKLSYPFSPVR